MFTEEQRKQTALFAASDGLALMIAFVGALSLHDPSGAMEARMRHTNSMVVIAAMAAVIGLWLAVFRAVDLYRVRNGGLKEVLAAAKGCSIAALLALLAGFLAHLDVSRIAVVLGYLLSMPLVIAMRGLLRRAMRGVYANPSIAIPLLVAGFNPVARYLCDQMLDEMTQYELVGFADGDVNGGEYRGYPILGTPDRIAEFAAIYPALEVAIALPDAPREHQARIIRLCERHRLRWWMVPWPLYSMAAGLRVDMLGAVPLIGPRGSNIEGLNFAVKRGFDIAASALLLAIASPLLMLGALAIRVFDGRPCLFRQTRVGIHGKPFEILKLRTMRTATSDITHREYVKRWIGSNGTGPSRESGGKPIHKMSGDVRVTRVGKWLRRFSIDELPQLFNVLRGEMSLIGPRPALPYELELYQEWHRRRLDAPPGITGLWQVSGRNRLSFDEMVKLDVQYLEDWSLGNDLRILARTVPALLRGNGV